MAGKAEIANSGDVEFVAFLAGVDVVAPRTAAALVTFGDSITDGTRSTVNTNRRWPNFLDARLRARAKAVGSAW